MTAWKVTMKDHKGVIESENEWIGKWVTLSYIERMK